MSEQEGKSAPEAAPETPTQEQPFNDRLAAALERLAERPAGAPQPAPELPEPVDYEAKIKEALDEGETETAFTLMRESMLYENAKTQQTALHVQHANALEIARSTVPDFERWWPKVQELAQSRGLDPTHWTSLPQIKEAITYAKANNLDSLLDEQRETIRQELLKELASKEPAPQLAGSSIAPDDLPEGLSLDDIEEKDVKWARDLNMPIQRYAQAVKALEAFDSGTGAISRAPLIDDYDTTDEFGEKTIPPGKF